MVQQLEPFGRSNPEPLLRIDATLDQRIQSDGLEAVERFVFVPMGASRAIWFNAAEWLPRSRRGRRVQVLGVPCENRFRGSVTAELEVKDTGVDCRE